MFIGKTQEELEKKKAFETVAALISGADEIVPEPDTLPVMPLVDNRPIDFSGGVLSFDNNEDIDGEPLVDPDIDGLPMDDDVDGVPSKLSLFAYSRVMNFNCKPYDLILLFFSLYQ